MLCLKHELAVYWSCSCIFCAERLSERLLALHLSQSFTTSCRHYQLSSVTSIPKIDGHVFLMERVTWRDFHGP